MVKKSHSPEMIITKLREAEILLNQRASIGEASRKIGVTEQTYYQWRKEYGGMRMEQAKRQRRRLWLNDGSCIRLRPQHKDHVWSYDFVLAWTANGKAFRILVIIDEYTRECLAMLVARHITSGDVIEQLYELFLLRGAPEHIRSDDGPEFTAKAVRRWLNRVGVKTLFIEPGSPWENASLSLKTSLPGET